jgi:hypothetical protein
MIEFRTRLFVPAGAHRIQLVQLAVILGGELRREFRGHQVRLQTRQDARFADVTADGQEVGAGAAVACIRAAIVMLTDLREAATADAALQQVRQQVNRPARAFWPNTGIVMCHGEPDVLLPL